MTRIDAVAVCALVGLTACTDAAEQRGEETQVVQSAYSVASCATATADATFSDPFPMALLTNPTYNTCTKSFVLDLLNVGSNMAGGAITAKWNGVDSTSTEAGCLDTEGGAIFYKKVGTAWVPLTGQNVVNGVWQPANPPVAARCREPVISFGPMEKGASYRIAATMRRLSGGNPTRGIAISFRRDTPTEQVATTATLTAGPNHTCARLFRNTSLRCWGSGTGAKLGYGNSNHIGDDEAPSAASDVPLNDVSRVALGNLHTCAVVPGGGVRCWGAGATGALGYGNTSDVANVVGPNVPLGTPVWEIVAGDDHTCAITVPPVEAVRCWGAGSFGRLGYGNVNAIGDNETPASVGTVSVGGPVRQLAAGAQHTCALLDGGAVRCWGRNNHGQLGYGHTNDIGDNETPASAGDVAVGGPVASIAAGAFHTCAVLTTGRVRCWGLNTNGQLGYGHTNRIGDDETPASAGDVPQPDTVAQISLGARHTCIVSDKKRVRCWGAGSDGALGYGNTNDIGDNETPGSVADVPLGTVVQVAAGGTHTCAVLTTGNVKCWGSPGGAGKHGLPGAGIIGDDETPASVGNVQLWGGCADGSAEQQLRGDLMVGCAGISDYASRNALCAPGWTACSASQWVERRDGSLATHNYWTRDPLLYNGTGPGACWVSLTSGTSCGNTPMRVCTSASADAEGNICNWVNCGLESATPNQGFGGCVDNPTAGTLCCRQ